VKSDRRIPGSGQRRIVVVAVLGTVALALAFTAVTLLEGVTPGSPAPPPGRWGVSAAPSPAGDGIRTFTPPVDITITEDLVYGAQPDGTALKLDVCSPADRAPGTVLPAVVSIHAGSWTRGNKAEATWRNVCEWLASEGFVTYAVNYRLAPEDPFPAGADDLAAAVRWIRQPAQVERFGIDPARIGALGGSAGATLSAFLGARGSGALTSGARVAAVVELSGPTDLTEEALTADGASERLQRLIRRYLGCRSLADCPIAEDASPVRQLDRSDPPMFIANSTDEFVPLAQATRLADGLEAFGIEYELVTPEGESHSMGFLDASMRARIAAFLHRYLGE
jgi:acetyl esterase/lipase